MLDTEEQWSRALASNNVTVILRWLRSLLAQKGDAEADKRLATFSRWVQRTAEFSKKELLTLCLSRCQGLWMFLEQSSFTRVHLLVQKLRNLLILAQWGRRQPSLAALLWHGPAAACAACSGASGSSAAGPGCWERERRALKQHIWLGRLVQWWGITGLLPKYPDAQELRRISHMWREMDHSHRRACLHTPGWEEGGGERWSSLIEGMVAQVNKQCGPVWTPEACAARVYPPPSLQALLKLAVAPHVDNTSVQAIIMYFILDVANFLQCKDDLLRSFCHAFTIPPRFSQQIRGFWLLDRGHVSGSMELLLSPRSASPRRPWQHGCILRCLLRRKQPRAALKYLLWTGPALDGPDDLKLCVEVLLRNGRVTDAWALIRQGHTGSDDVVRYFLRACERLGLCAEASHSKAAVVYKSEDHDDDDDVVDYDDNVEAERECGEEESSLRPQRAVWTHSAVKEAALPLRPFSALLYQYQKTNTVSSEDVVRLLREAVRQLRPPRLRASEVVWMCEVLERGHSGLGVSSQDCLHAGPFLLDTPDLEEDQTLITAEYYPCSKEKPRSPGRLSSPSSSSTGSSESVSPLTSASSSPPRPTRGRPYEYESTVTLQRMSAFLEREERAAASADASPGRSDLALTLEGAKDPDSFNSLSEEREEPQAFCAERGAEEILTRSSPLVGETAGRSAVQDLPSDRRLQGWLNLHPQFYSNEDNQSVSHMESHNFLTPDYASIDQSERVLPQTSNAIGLVESQRFLELEPLQRVSEPPQLAEAPECFPRDSQHAADQPEILTSCALTEVTQQDQTAPGSATEGEPESRGPGGRHGRRRFSLQDSSLLTPGLRPPCLSRPLRTPGGSPSPGASPPRTPQRSLPGAETAGRGGVPGAVEALPELNSWRKQTLETHRAPSGLLLAFEQVPAMPEERASRVPGRPCSPCHTVLDPSVKQKGDKPEAKQAEEAEPAAHRASGTAPQRRAELEHGAPRQPGAWPRRVKRVKKA